MISAQVAKHEKRLRDREMFREQAKLQRSQREAAHRAEALSGRGLHGDGEPGSSEADGKLRSRAIAVNSM